jgi:hypothetical protein
LTCSVVSAMQEKTLEFTSSFAQRYLPTAGDVPLDVADPSRVTSEYRGFRTHLFRVCVLRMLLRDVGKVPTCRRAATLTHCLANARYEDHGGIRRIRSKEVA